MLEAIRCLSSGDISLLTSDDGRTKSADGMTSARSSTATSETMVTPTLGGAAPAAAAAAAAATAAAAGSSGKSKSKSRSSNSTPMSPKSDVTAETYNISESSSSFTAPSTVSSHGGRAARTADVPATSARVEKAPASLSSAAGVQVSKEVDSPPRVQGSSKASRLLPSAKPVGGEGGGKILALAQELSASGLVVKKVKSGKADGVEVTPKAAAGEGEEEEAQEEEEEEEEEKNPWNKPLPEMLSPAARRYAATYLATCVRQALQRNPDQMAR